MVTPTPDSLQLHFAHANGFPAASYRRVLDALPEHWQVMAHPCLACDERFPVTDNWENQAKELVNYVERQRHEHEPVVAVGHSFGAVVSYIAACQRPELFAGLIMLDPPLVTGLSAWMFKFAKRTPMIDKLTPAGRTKNRTQKWPAETDLFQYFAKRSLFQGFERECIEDYIDAATIQQEGVKHLRFPAETEANLFRTVPHNLSALRGMLQCPALLVTGEDSEVCRPKQYQRLLQHNPIGHCTHPGGHMFPFQYPDSVAELITRVSSQMLSQFAHD